MVLDDGVPPEGHASGGISGGTEADPYVHGDLAEALCTERERREAAEAALRRVTNEAVVLRSSSTDV
jgi:hypothetical protein